MKKILFTLLAVLASLFVLRAQDLATNNTLKPIEPPTEETTPDETEQDAGIPISISGYVDAYYQYNFNRPKSLMNTGRVFDQPHNNFSLGLAQTMFKYTTDKAEAVVDLVYGPNAELGNFGNVGTSFSIKQAYITYNITEKLSVTAGQYGTHIGYEVIDAPLNANYSLSNLFANGPFYHTGVKLGYAFSDKVSAMFGVVNGWDGLRDFNDKKSLTAQVALAPSDKVSILVNWVGGDEYGGLSAFGDLEGSYTNLTDVVANFTLSEKATLGVHVLYGSFLTGADEFDENDPWSQDASWGGSALYLKLNLSEKLGLNLRGEYFKDKNGIRFFGPVEINALTVTADVKLVQDHLMFKPEFRIDKSKDNFFEKHNGELTDLQSTIGGALVFSF